MKERPIIINTSLIPATLQGRKTQTRRVIKPQPTCHCAKPDWRGQIISWRGYKYKGRQGWFCYICGNGLKPIDEWSAHGILCPYGQVGDRLWVKETWMLTTSAKDNEIIKDWFVVYKDGIKVVTEPDQSWLFRDRDNCFDKWRSSRFMPRWASRITLEITGIRVERLKDIWIKDAIAEGCSLDFDMKHFGNFQDPISKFQTLWDSLNAMRGYGWETNPFVWVLEFEVGS